MNTGTIKTILQDKHFGFITPDNQKPGDRDIFFHEESLGGAMISDFKPGDKVSFEIAPAGPSDKGPKATSVKRM